MSWNEVETILQDISENEVYKDLKNNVYDQYEMFEIKLRRNAIDIRVWLMLRLHEQMIQRHKQVKKRDSD